MEDVPGQFTITNTRISLNAGAAGRALLPVLHGGEIRIRSHDLGVLAHQVLPDPLNLTHLSLALVSCRLLTSSIEAVLKVRRGRLEQTVKAEIALTPAEGGALRVTIERLRIGILPASWVLDALLGYVNHQPGLRKSGPQAIDIEVATLLRAFDVPLIWQAGVLDVAIRDDALAIVLG